MSSLPTEASQTTIHRPKLFDADFLMKVGSFLFALVAIYLVYSAYVWPAAEEAAEKSRVAMQRDKNYVAPRNLAVIVKDPEQQFEVTFWVWAIIMLTVKLVRLSKENDLLGQEFLRLEPGERILPDDSLAHYKDLQALLDRRPAWRARILPNVILGALHRFHCTQAIGDASAAIKERTEVAANDFEADLALIRYIAWAIPALGFIGTVRGIGEALAQAQKAISGDLSGVIDALGLAFNSTLVALLLSMVLMFLMNLMQGRQDRLAVDIQSYCEEHVVGQMKVPSQGSTTPAFQG